MNRQSVKTIVHSALIIALVTAYVFFRKAQEEYLAITTFEQCVEAGYPVITTYPEECKIPGKVFTNTEQIASEKQPEIESVEPHEVIKDYKNSSYSIDGQRVVVKDGTGVSRQLATTSVALVTIVSNEITADFDDNNFMDTSVILKVDGGNTGTFYYFALSLGSSTGNSGTNSIFIGDRILPKSTVFTNGEFTLSYYDRGLREPASNKPTKLMTRKFKLINGTLTEILKAIQ